MKFIARFLPLLLLAGCAVVPLTPLELQAALQAAALVSASPAPSNSNSPSPSPSQGTPQPAPSPSAIETPSPRPSQPPTPSPSPVIVLIKFEGSISASDCKDYLNDDEGTVEISSMDSAVPYFEKVNIEYSTFSFTKVPEDVKIEITVRIPGCSKKVTHTTLKREFPDDTIDLDISNLNSDSSYESPSDSTADTNTDSTTDTPDTSEPSTSPSTYSSLCGPGQIYVNGYFRKSGVYVHGYCRSR